MLYKPDFPKMQKFDGEYYKLERIHDSEEELRERGRNIVRRGKALSQPARDYRVIEKEGYFGLYLK